MGSGAQLFLGIQEKYAQIPGFAPQYLRQQ
jgi:hypothetical protein